MTKEIFLSHALSYENVLQDYPFQNPPANTYAVLRHAHNKKWFALLFEKEGRQLVNLKSEPQKADFWRNVSSAVTPGWHMNRTHWNTVDLLQVEEEMLLEMLYDSYHLTK